MTSEIFSNKILYSSFSKIDKNERKCLTALAKEWLNIKPLLNKKILINCHITRSTLIMIDLLLLAGATITITATKELAVHKNILAKLLEAEINFIPNGKIPHEMQDNYFDVLFDCGAGLLNKVHPSQGTVELTHTPQSIYSNIKHTVISVDESYTKLIETYYGTGNALVRLFREKIAKDTKFNHIHRALLLAAQYLKKTDYSVAIHLEKKADSVWFENNKYVVFGYGKVGKGIVDALKNAGVKPKNIIVIDKMESACKKATEKKFKAYCLNESNFSKIKKELQNAYAIVTATGVKECISNNFKHSDFPENVIKINMGTPDEWGHKFSELEILNKKKPANFLMKYPTKVAYLDAIFEAMLRACLLLTNGKKLSNGFIPLPQEIDNIVASNWQKYYPELCHVDSLIDILDNSPDNKKQAQKRPLNTIEHIYTT